MAVIRILASAAEPSQAHDPLHCHHPWPLEMGQVRYLFRVGVDYYGNHVDRWYEMRPGLGDVLLKRW